MPPPPQASLLPQLAHAHPDSGVLLEQDMQVQLKPPRPTMTRRSWPAVTARVPVTNAPPPPAPCPSPELAPAAPHMKTPSAVTPEGTV